MVLLFVNLVCGAIIRSPKNWRQPGMLIAHGGIIFLVLASFVTAEMSISGHMTLFEKESSKYFDDYYLWEVAITELDRPEGARTFTIKDAQLAPVKGGKPTTYHHPELPFALELSNWAPNVNPRQAAPMLNETGVDGVVLDPVPMEKEAERNLAGRDRDGAAFRGRRDEDELRVGLCRRAVGGGGGRGEVRPQPAPRAL
jgi:hypothetical protein